MSAKDVYKEIGYGFDDLIKQNPAYRNTCAVRLSLALIRSGVHFTGRLPIKNGPYRGRMIESGAKLLADQLARAVLFGRPAVFASQECHDPAERKAGRVFVLENYRLRWWAH